jgi:hypothetical protein
MLSGKRGVSPSFAVKIPAQIGSSLWSRKPTILRYQKDIILEVGRGFSLLVAGGGEKTGAILITLYIDREQIQT